MTRRHPARLCATLPRRTGKADGPQSGAVSSSLRPIAGRRSRGLFRVLVDCRLLPANGATRRSSLPDSPALDLVARIGSFFEHTSLPIRFFPSSVLDTADTAADESPNT